MNGVACRTPGGVDLLGDVSFRVGDGEHVALVGANGAGKTTLFRVIAGDQAPHAGSVHVDGRLRVMRQLVGWREEGRTVREMLLDLSPTPLQRAASDLSTAEQAAADDPGDRTGMALARAHTAWGDAGGWDAEVLWDTCTTIAVRQPLNVAGERPLATLSGGEQKRLALEVLLRSDADVLLLDEPDNYLDVPGKEWLEESLLACPKSILLISHDRQLLAGVAQRVVTLEGRTAWVHGGSFSTWHDAREARLARIDDEHRQWQEERKRMQSMLVEYRRRASMGSDTFASRVRATKTKIERFEAAPPRERVVDHQVTMRLGGDRTGMALARAHTAWGDAGGWDAEVLWDTCTTIAVRQPLDVAGERPLATLSGGEQKRLALEVLLRSDADVLLLDEPDNYLDVPGKEWLEASLRACPKSILLISHDRQLLAGVAQRVVTLEGRTAWVHGGSFSTWHEAREARLARIDDEHRQWQEERKRMQSMLVEYRRRASMGSDTFA